jgi:hypothetical protein
MIVVLLVGIGTMLLSLLCYSMATGLMIHVVYPLLHRKQAGLTIQSNMVVMVMVSLATAFVHLIQIILWAWTIRLCGESSTFETAFYFSAQNYTALGYGDVKFSDPWRLLGPLEAVNGLLLFGLSTAVMFAVMSRLIVNRFRGIAPVETTTSNVQTEDQQ